MKKFIADILMIAAVLFAVSCEQEVMEGNNRIPGKEIIVSAGVAPVTKVSYAEGSESVKVSWNETNDESFTVLVGTGEAVTAAQFTQSGAPVDGKALFHGEIPEGTADDAKLYAVYPSYTVGTGNPAAVAVDLSSQTGKYAENNCWMYAVSTVAESLFRFSHLTSVLKLTLTFKDAEGNALSGTAKNIQLFSDELVNKATADLTAAEPSVEASAKGNIALTGEFPIEDGAVDVYVYVLPGTSHAINYTAEIGDLICGGTISARASKPIEAGKVYTKSLEAAYVAEKAWSYAYEESGVVKGSSPAVSPDGKIVYVVSSNYALVGVDAATGEQKYDVLIKPEGETVTKKDEHAWTPSVAADGTVYAAGYVSATNAGFYKVKDGVVQKTGDLGTISNTGHYYYGSPALWSHDGTDYVIVATKNMKNSTMGGSNANTQIFNASTAEIVATGKGNSGLFGSPVVLKNSGTILAVTGGYFGSKVYLHNNGKWTANDTSASSDNEGNIASGGNQQKLSPGGSYMAVDNNGTTVYILGKAGETGETKVQRYDLAKVISAPNTIAPTPVWQFSFDGGSISNSAIGGVVLDESGIIYATNSKPGSIVALKQDGNTVTKIWEHKAAGDINGAPAVDNNGGVYYNDSKKGLLVKLNAADGSVVFSIKVADDLRTSPTIGPDGTVYCNGLLNDKPTVTAIKTTATAPADSWSQMGGDWTKASNKY